MAVDFAGDRVLVTGGSRGIGRACALAFAERGARVAINYLGNTAAVEGSEFCTGTIIDVNGASYLGT